MPTSTRVAYKSDTTHNHNHHQGSYTKSSYSRLECNWYHFVSLYISEVEFWWNVVICFNLFIFTIYAHTFTHRTPKKLESVGLILFRDGHNELVMSRLWSKSNFGAFLCFSDDQILRRLRAIKKWMILILEEKIKDRRKNIKRMCLSAKGGELRKWEDKFWNFSFKLWKLKKFKSSEII